jgi:probable phosphoglycerate mutase
MLTLPKKKFYFLRHGKTDWNSKQLCQGQKDIPLNFEGKEEVKKICPLAATLPFDRIITSPLSRALETGSIIQRYTRHPLIVVEELQERNWGDKEGISSEEMYAIELREETEADFIPGFNIENRHLFKQRILSGMIKSLTGDTPLIISHGRVFLILLEILNQPPLRQLPHSSIIECEPIENGWNLKAHTLSALF